MAKILLAEDNENLGFLIQDNLQGYGHEVAWRKNGKTAFDAFRNEAFEICLLDVMMPELDGFELARQIRQVNEFLPILFLTAKTSEEDRLLGFEIGGDDYISKPFSMKELNYRIEVFLRRTSNQLNVSEQKECLYFGRSKFDLINLQYCFGNHSPKTLTHMEGQLLKVLLENLNTLVKREKILVDVWGEDDYFKGRSLDVFITRLRKYLKVDPSIEIRNHHGVGFTLLDRSSGQE